MPAESFDLRLVVPFVAVAASATYSSAATDLGMTSSALAERITRLERQLGARLFDRDGRRVALTPAGRRFLVEAGKIVARAGQIAAALRAEPGTVRVHLVAAAASDELRAAIGRFVGERPGVRLAITEGTTAEASDALRRGDVDVTIDYPHGRPPGTSYAVWNRKPFVLVCSPDHRLADREEADWTDLEGDSVFVASPGVLDGYVAALRAALARADVHMREAPAYRVSTASYMVPRVARGDAVMILPEWSYPRLPPGLACVRLRPAQEIEVGASWNASTTSPAVRGFVALLRSVAPIGAGGDLALADRCP